MQRAQFRSDDAFIAFIDMDVRVRESGQFRGRRKLTRKGEPELRRLLFSAAMQDRRNAHWQPDYLALRERGLSSSATMLMISISGLTAGPAVSLYGSPTVRMPAPGPSRKFMPAVKPT